MIRRVTLSGVHLSPLSEPLEVPESENPVQLIPVSQRYDDHADSNPHENPKPDILMMSQVTSSQGEQDRPEKPACAPNDKELCCAQVPQPENITQPVLGKTRDEKKQKDKERGFVAQEIVKSLHGGLGDEPLYEGPAECSSEDERGIRTDREPYGGEHNTKKLTEQVPSENACHFTGDRSGNHLSDLKQDKDKHRPRAEGVKKMGHSLFVQEKLDDACFVEDEGQAPHNQDENQKPEPDVDGFSLLRLLKIDVIFSRIVPLRLSVNQLSAFLQAQ